MSIDKITQSSSVAAAIIKKSLDAQSNLSLKCDLKSGDRVMVKCKNNKIVEGTIKYVGYNEKNTEPGPVIGIQLVSTYIHNYICSHMYVAYTIIY